MRKFFFPVLIYLSLACLIYYLIRIDYLSIRLAGLVILPFILSLFFLWLGIILSAVSWGYALRIHGVEAGIINAVVSHGQPVFAKYIPGKVWVILGRASRIPGSFSLNSLVSLKEQLIYLLLGLLISILPVFYLYGTGWLSLGVLLTIVLLVLVIFSGTFHRLFTRILNVILKKEAGLPLLSVRDGIKIGRLVLLYWASWLLAFYFLLQAFHPGTPFMMAFAFPVSVVYGVLVIFAPGGIGVREGIMSGFLVLAGMDPSAAISLSLITRLWFISGELVIFLLSVALDLLPPKNK